MQPTLIFDLDGTLVHSAPDICAAANHALKPLGARTLTADEISLMIGNGLPKLLERAFAAAEIPPDRQQFDETYAAFISYYEAHPAVLSRLYPGTLEALETLAGEGFTLCVCTNKLEAIALEVLDGLNIRRFFKSVVGGSPGRPQKPDPAPLIKAVKDAGGDPAQAILIGDSGADAALARAAPCPLILVSFGYSHEPVSSLGAALVVDDMSAMPGAVHSVILSDSGAA